MIVFPRKKYMWAYYDGGVEQYAIDGDYEAYRYLKYAMAILSVDPNKIIYLPIQNPGVGRYYTRNYNVVLARPELQLRRSEWVNLRRQLNKAHRTQQYILRYEQEKLWDQYEKLYRTQTYYKELEKEKQEVNELVGETVFMVLLKQTCLKYHHRIAETIERQETCVWLGYLGWLLGPKVIWEMEESRKICYETTP